MPIRHIISQSFGHMCLNIGELRIERISQYIDDMNKMPTLFKWKYKMDKMAGGIVVDKERGLLIC